MMGPGLDWVDEVGLEWVDPQLMELGCHSLPSLAARLRRSLLLLLRPLARECPNSSATPPSKLQFLQRPTSNS